MLEAGSSTIECPMFRTGVDCSQTYAVHLGVTYLTFRVLYTIAIMTSIQYSFPKTTNMWFVKSFQWSTVQTRIHVYMAIGQQSLVLRAVDPLGYTDSMPYTILILAYDIGGVCLFSIGYEIIFDWLRLVNQSQGNQHVSSYLRRICILFQCLAFFFSVFFGLIMTMVGPIWIWHLVKVLCLIILSIGSVIYFVKYGMVVWRIMLENEEQDGVQDNEFETYKNLKTALADPQQAISAGIPTDLLQLQLNKSRLQDRVIPTAPARASRKQPRLMLLIVILSLLLVAVWVYVLYNEISYRATYNHPYPAPEHAGHVQAASVLDIVHFVCFISVPIFFGTIPKRKHNPNNHVDVALQQKDPKSEEYILPASALFASYVPSTQPDISYIATDSPNFQPIGTNMPASATVSPALMSLRPSSVLPTNQFSLSVNSQSTAKMMLVHKNVMSVSSNSPSSQLSPNSILSNDSPNSTMLDTKPILIDNPEDASYVYAGHTMGSIMAQSIGYTAHIPTTSSSSVPAKTQSTLYTTDMQEAKSQFQPQSMMHQDTLLQDVNMSLRLTRTLTANKKMTVREHTPVRVNTYDTYDMVGDVQALFNEMEQSNQEKHSPQ